MRNKEFVDYFTPCSTILTELFGLIASAIYGKVWNYEGMKDGECWASQSTIAKELRLHRTTVNRWLNKLDEGGYIEKYSIEGKRSNAYKTTNKLEFETVLNRNVQNATSTYSNKHQVPVAESDTNRVYKKKRNNNGSYDSFSSLNQKSKVGLLIKDCIPDSRTPHFYEEDKAWINSVCAFLDSDVSKITPSIFDFGLLLVPSNRGFRKVGAKLPELSPKQVLKLIYLRLEFGEEKFHNVLEWIADTIKKTREMWTVKKCLGVLQKQLPVWELNKSEFASSYSKPNKFELAGYK